MHEQDQKPEITLKTVKKRRDFITRSSPFLVPSPANLPSQHHADAKANHHPAILSPLSDYDHKSMKLIGSFTSPYVRKVRIVMAEKKLDYRFEVENVWMSETRIQQYNPLGKVPCLIMEDGGTLFDSRVIVEYLDTLSPVARLIPQSGRERAAVKCWEAIADGVVDACIAIMKEKQRPETQPGLAWIDRQYGKIYASLDAMNKSLGENTHCMGVNHSLADVAVGCALGYLDFRFSELNWRLRHLNLARLYEKLSTRPEFIDTLPPPETAERSTSRTYDQPLEPNILGNHPAP